jgi:hypothetical protein
VKRKRNGDEMNGEEDEWRDRIYITRNLLPKTISVHNPYYDFSFYHFLNTINICSFSMMTAILLFHASSNSSDPFHSPSQYMKNRNHGSIFER